MHYYVWFSQIRSQMLGSISTGCWNYISIITKQLRISVHSTKGHSKCNSNVICRYTSNRKPYYSLKSTEYGRGITVNCILYKLVVAESIQTLTHAQTIFNFWQRTGKIWYVLKINVNYKLWYASLLYLNVNKVMSGIYLHFLPSWTTLFILVAAAVDIPFRTWLKCGTDWKTDSQMDWLIQWIFNYNVQYTISITHI